MVHFDDTDPLKVLLSARQTSPNRQPLDPASPALLCVTWGNQPESSAALRLNAIIEQASSLLTASA